MRQVRRQLPQEDTICLADQPHTPYGSRGLAGVRELSETIARFLLDRGAKVIVVACNTASAAALHHLRRTFPGVPFRYHSYFSAATGLRAAARIAG